MLIKCEDERDGIVLARVRDRLADDLLMTEMHAIKHADGQADFPSARGKFSCSVDDFHR